MFDRNSYGYFSKMLYTGTPFIHATAQGLGSLAHSDCVSSIFSLFFFLLKKNIIDGGTVLVKAAPRPVWFH